LTKCQAPSGHTHSICTIDHAEKTWGDYQEFLKDPGPAIIGAMPGASCFGPAYEFSFIFNKDLQRRKLRNKVPMTHISPEPYVGHMGLGGVSGSKAMLESEFRNNDIKWITNAKVTKVEAGKMFVTELDDSGQVRKEHELPFKFSMMLPAFKGVDPVAAVEGLCNPRGFVLIDEYQRSKKYRNIFSAGVCVAIPPVEVTPVPTGAPKPAT
jgi:sulfide:quinone oxidoreductase